MIDQPIEDQESVYTPEQIAEMEKRLAKIKAFRQFFRDHPAPWKQWESGNVVYDHGLIDGEDRFIDLAELVTAVNGGYVE